MRFLTAGNNVFEKEGKHYITIAMACLLDNKVEPQVSLSLAHVSFALQGPFDIGSIQTLTCWCSSWNHRSAMGGSGLIGRKCVLGLRKI
jgi:hypothetical protein